MSFMVSFCAVLFPTDVLDEIWDLIDSVSEEFPTYSKLFMTVVQFYKFLLFFDEYRKLKQIVYLL